MKIVYDAALFPGAGGGPRHYAGISRGLAAAGIEVIHLLPVGSPAMETKLPGEVVELRCPGRGKIARQLMYELARVLVILRWFVTGRRVDVWMARHSIFGVGLFLSKLVARRTLLEVNGPVKEEMRANFGSSAAAGVADAMLGLQIRASDLVLPVTQGLADYLSPRRSPRLHVLPNGADELAPAEQERRPGGLVFAGALTPWYDLLTVLDAVAHLRDAGVSTRLTVVGDGVGRREVERRIASHDLQEQVNIMGWVTGEVVVSELLRNQIGVLPLSTRPKVSRWSGRR